MFLPLDRLDHFSTCSDAEETDKLRQELAEEERGRRDKDPRFQTFACPNCRDTLRLTPIEILRHKRSCKGV